MIFIRKSANCQPSSTSGRHAANPLVALITALSLALQSLTTRQPDDDQIEIAIAAMQQAQAADAECAEAAESTGTLAAEG